MELLHYYRKYKPCKKALSKITKQLGDGIIPYLGNRLYALRFSRSIGINRKIIDPQHPVCVTIAIRLGHIPPPEDLQDYQIHTRLPLKHDL